MQVLCMNQDTCHPVPGSHKLSPSLPSVMCTAVTSIGGFPMYSTVSNALYYHTHCLTHTIHFSAVHTNTPNTPHHRTIRMLSIHCIIGAFMHCTQATGAEVTNSPTPNFHNNSPGSVWLAMLVHVQLWQENSGNNHFGPWYRYLGVLRRVQTY